jgi:hypothetical protein
MYGRRYQKYQYIITPRATNTSARILDGKLADGYGTQVNVTTLDVNNQPVVNQVRLGVDNSSEKEVLFLPGSSFLITEIDEDSSVVPQYQDSFDNQWKNRTVIKMIEQ